MPPNPLSENSPPKTKAKARPIVIPAIILSLILMTVAGWWFLYYQPSLKNAASYLELKEKLEPLIRGEDLGPCPQTELLDHIGTPAINNSPLSNVTEGAKAFCNHDYNKAATLFDSAHLGDSDPRVLSFIAATSLRLSNYSQARDYYEKAIQLLPKTSKRLKAQNQLGLALALFYLMELDLAQKPAEEAFNYRKATFGDYHLETLSALNILSTIFIGQNKSHVAGEMLNSAVLGALGTGISKDIPVISDSLNILALIYRMEGRLEELADLKVPGAVKDETQDNSKKSEEKKEEPFNYDEAKRLLIELTEKYPASNLRSDLMMAMIRHQQGEGPLCRAPLETIRESPEVSTLRDKITLSLCLALAENLLYKERYEAAVPILTELSDRPPSIPNYSVKWIYEESARAYFNLRRFSEAEKSIRKAIKTVEDHSELSTKDVAFILTQTIFLSDIILAQNKINVEAEMELVSVQTRLSKRLTKKSLDSCPEAALVQIHLARLLAIMKRNRDSQNSYNKSEKIIKAALKAFPERTEELEMLKEEIRKDRQSKPVSPKPYSLAAPSKNEILSTPPPAEIMRLELAALKTLNRLMEFKDPINKALNWAKDNYGANSFQYLRYFSLNLKYLEETENYQELLASLDILESNPRGDTERERNINKSATMNYRARILKKTGDTKAANEIWKKALTLLPEEKEMEARKKDIMLQLEEIKQNHE